MKSAICGAAFALLAVCAGTGPARADEDIPAYKALSCEKDCPRTVAAKRIHTSAIQYPFNDLRPDDVYVEALVDVDYTIATDGTVKDPVIENLLGAKEFADAVVRGVLQRTYQPATEDGKPVEENHRLRIMFEVSPSNSKGGRLMAVAAYDKAEALVLDNKLPEAIAAFKVIAGQPRLNLYERTMIGLAMADAYFRSKDFWSARDAIRIATIGEGKFLSAKSVESALRLRIRLEAINGDFAESFAWFHILRDKGFVKPDDTDKALVEKMRGMIAGAGSLAATARIPEPGGSVFWQHTLLRRSFEFHDVVGALDRFELHCDRHSILSPVSDKANWTVPASWSGCFVNVYGTPGTTFHLVELQAAS